MDDIPRNFLDIDTAQQFDALLDGVQFDCVRRDGLLIYRHPATKEKIAVVEQLQDGNLYYAHPDLVNKRAQFVKPVKKPKHVRLEDIRRNL